MKEKKGKIKKIDRIIYFIFGEDLPYHKKNRIITLTILFGFTLIIGLINYVYELIISLL